MTLAARPYNMVHQVMVDSCSVAYRAVQQSAVINTIYVPGIITVVKYKERLRLVVESPRISEFNEQQQYTSLNPYW